MNKKFLITIYLVSTTAFAQSSSSTISTEISTLPAEVSKKITVSADLSQSSNLVEETSANAERSTDLKLSLSKNLANKNKASVVLGVSRSQTGFEDTLISDTVLVYTLNPKKINRDNTATYSGRLILPTSKASNEDAGLRAALSGRAMLTSKKQLLGKSTTINSFVDALKYNHKFETNSERNGNMNYRVRIASGLSLKITETVTIGASGYYQAGKTYQDTTKASFYLAEEVSYTPKKNGTSFYLAHSNDGNALGPNGEDSTIKAYDSRKSVITAGLRASF